MHTYRRMIDSRPSNLSSWTFFILLWPWSNLFSALVKLRATLYRLGLKSSYRAAVPVISIGNLTVGGTGKTPVVDVVVRKLLDSGVRVAVVSRGYGGTYRGDVACVAQGDGQLLLTSQEAGDEPCLLSRRNPALRVYVARRRILGVQAAERAGAQVIVLDDGFQHLAVHRDIDIVLLDARAPFGNGQLLPAGPLRESISALGRASLVIMTHAEQRGRVLPFHGQILYCRPRLADTLRSLDGADVPWSQLEGREVLAFAGIAHPDDFFAALRRRGVALAATMALNDHQDYSIEILKQLGQSCDNEKLWLTTEKDAVKLHQVDLPCPCLVVPLVLDFDEPAELDRVIDGIVSASHRGKGTLMSLSKDLLDILACPQCKGPVTYAPAAREICCAPCSLAYPVRDDIPVMLIDEARSLADSTDPTSSEA